MNGRWIGVEVPDVLGVWTALEEADGGADGGGGNGGIDGGGTGGAGWVWTPFVLIEVVDAVDAAAMAAGGAVALLLLPALVLPLLFPLLVVAVVLELPVEDLKEDKRFCAEDLRRIMVVDVDGQKG
jgi:hypothetical protein